MADTPERLVDSPVDFETALAYALQPEMRRLVILYIVGVILLPVGLDLLVSGRFHPLVVGIAQHVLGLVLVVVGAALLFGGLIGAAFKVVTDANLLAADR